ncbi:glycoside hydrolase family 15 protein [Compostibacter hankyongensis]|uniref:Glucan 1,4-alpha-glucosidase n=1 Tax=Compostibacter hankyongensis TaxID=1007089 RepID=A0ABP8FYM7_9BACT
MTGKWLKAPGSPGIPARWTSSAKSGLGKAINAASDVSFTVSHGIINEIYFPWEDVACTRDMGLIVTDRKTFFSEEKRHAEHRIKMIGDGLPAYRITNTCLKKRYRIVKEVMTDTIRNTLVQRVSFRALKGKISDYGLYVLLAPHLGNQGSENSGWCGDYKGVSMLFARRDNLTLALACSSPWKKQSVGFVGFSDGWQDLMQHKQMEWEYRNAGPGNIALTAQADLEASGGELLIALGFGYTENEAAHYARGSILSGFDEIREAYLGEWRSWQKSFSPPKPAGSPAGKLFRISASVLRIHEAKRARGGIIASMSVPWGEAKGDEDIGGYHLVWPRDLVESSGGLLALNAKQDTLRILTYLMVTQEADGHWAQNMWLEGTPHWKGIQMDQVALPILLIDLCRQNHVLKPARIHRYWHTVKKALSYLVQNGPYTEQDRWERAGGLSLFTLAAEIAALLAGADFAEENNEPAMAAYCRETADCWNAHIERWTYITDTDISRSSGVEGYYIRLNPTGADMEALRDQRVRVENHPEESSTVLLSELISPDALALVRFGLRAPDDPHICNTVRMIDKYLKVDTPTGPCWHRYTHDGYGEHEDGSPYDGTGIGRAWPLLTGERAHYEIAAGNIEGARELAKTMESFSHNGLFPEQIWDAADIPDRELFFGKYSGSAMPLVWAHAEYIKLCRSLKQRKVFDMPRHARERYLHNQRPSAVEIWRFERPLEKINKNSILRIETHAPARIHWSADGWQTTQDALTQYTGLGIYFADFPGNAITGPALVFTFYWMDADRWEHKDFAVEIIADP